MDPSPVNFQPALRRFDNANKFFMCEEYKALRENIIYVTNPETLCENPHFIKVAALSFMEKPLLVDTFNTNMQVICKAVKYSYHCTPETKHKYIWHAEQLINVAPNNQKKAEYYIYLAKALQKTDPVYALSNANNAYKIIKKGITNHSSDLKLKLIKVLCELDVKMAFKITKKIFHNSEAEKTLALHQVFKHSSKDPKKDCRKKCRKEITKLFLLDLAERHFNDKNIKICLDIVDKKDLKATEKSLSPLDDTSLKLFDNKARLSILCKMQQSYLEINRLTDAEKIIEGLTQELGLVPSREYSNINKFDVDIIKFRVIENNLMVGKKLKNTQPEASKKFILSALQLFQQLQKSESHLGYTTQSVSLICDIYNSQIFTCEEITEGVKLVKTTINAIGNQRDKVIALSMLLSNKSLFRAL